MKNKKEALKFLETEIEKRGKKTTLSFEEYLELVKREPQKVLRNIFQLFYDMVKSSVGEGVDEYPGDPESIGFVKYDCSRLFVEKADNPFFADRLFANRFIRQIESLRQGFQQNRIYVYEGPSGCGKSTFLNNLLRTFETYTDIEEGQTFEIIWEIDGNLSFHGSDKNENLQDLIIPCPSHDYPILIIPKDYRAGFLERLLPNETDKEIEIKSEIFGEKDYEWLFNGEVCTICKSIFWSLFCMLGSIDKVLSMVKVRPYKFDRRLGEGISIFNPGDKPTWGIFDGKPVGGNFTNKHIQERLDQIFGANAVRYVFSPLAKTNNGIYVLMDIKSHNEDRLMELHNVISEGVHKVGDVEEQINSLFFALMNPEDKRVIEEKKMESFQGRIQYNKVPFVLEPLVEVNIYQNIFGESINNSFLPRVLENFAKVIIASRMNPECKPFKEWIPNIAEKYKRFCDENGFLLRMKLYGGVIPDWLSEEDKRKFTAPIRRVLIAEGENDGNRGFSGRESIRFFGEFFSRYSGRSNLINMGNVTEFFKHKIGRGLRDDYIPKNFLASLVDLYDYTVLNEMKEALYFYNKERISKDILNYLCAINYDIGSKIKSQYTGEDIEVTVDFFKQIGAVITGKEMKDQEALNFARDTQKKYVIIIAKDQSNIAGTELYHYLSSSYARNLKEKALQPFIGNANFREAIKSFGAKEFDTFDTRLKEHVAYMIKNLMEKFSYTEQGAKEICLYVIDKELPKKFQ